MFSEKLTEEDLPQNGGKWSLKKKIILFIVIPIIIIIIIAISILIFVLLRKKASDSNETVKYVEKEAYIENINNYLIADFKLNDTIGLINTGLSNTSKIIDYKTEKGYFYGGQVNLNSTYSNCTIIAIVQYNKTSKDRLFGKFAYYGGAIDFKELTGNRQRKIGLEYGNSEIDTNYIFPNHSYLNKYYDGKYLVENEDIFFALSSNRNESKFYVQVNEDYHEVNRWCENVRKTFTLSSEHKFKEIRIYSTQLPKKNLMEEFNKTGIKLNTEIYSIDNFKEVDNKIDNSKYESLHIINKINILYYGYKYALSAIPYPFEINHSGKSDQYDVNWISSDENIAKVVDGLVIPKKLGKVTITAKLLRTNIIDSVTIEIVERNKPKEKIKYISNNYKSKDGNIFSNTNYTMTSQAIFDAIDEAYKEGYNHIVFPKINFYCNPLDNIYYIPTGMTVEFPKGSKFFMKPSEKAKKGYTFFSIGWPTWDNHGYFKNIPKEKATIEKSKKTGNITGYYIDDAHLIIDKYYGEFYDEKIKIEELADNASKFSASCIFVFFGKCARYSSVEIHTANCTAGAFMKMGGQTWGDEIKGKDYIIPYFNFTKGRLNDKGELDSSAARWFTTNGFFEIGKKVDDTDFYENYVLTNAVTTSTATVYHSARASTEHLYDIAWYDENRKFLKIDRWRYVDENYIRGEGAKYFKISIHQTNQPKKEDCYDNKTYIYFMPAGSSHFCEIKNTNLYHSADGLVSVIGETNNCWIHDNYLYNDGYLYGWALDLENGRCGMRGTIIENNVIRKYQFDKHSKTFYSYYDSGYLCLSGGFNTFVINNYIGAIVQNDITSNTHIIHNTIGCLFGSYNRTDKRFYEMRSKSFVHVYNNVMGYNNADYHDNTQNGKVYLYDNYYDIIVNKLEWIDSMFSGK